MFTPQETAEIRNIVRSAFIDDITDILASLNALQPEWIPVTYINSWVDYDANSNTEYYKDILGNVHLRIRCKDGVADQICDPLPVGYRPQQEERRYVYSVPDAGYIPGIIISTAGVIAGTHYTTSIRTGEIIYRVA